MKRAGCGFRRPWSMKSCGFGRRGSLEILQPAPRVLPGVDEIMTREEMLSFLTANLMGQHASQRDLAENLLSELNATDPDLVRRYRHLEVRVLVERLRDEGRGGQFNGVVGSRSLAMWKKQFMRNGMVLLSPTFFQDYGNCPFLFWARMVLGPPFPRNPWTNSTSWTRAVFFMTF